MPPVFFEDPTPEQAIELFKALEASFPSRTLGEENWYLVAAAAVCGGNQPDHLATLYSYLITKPQYSTSEQRQNLIRRLRETLVECVSIIGVCKPLEAIFAIAKVERPQDRDYSFSRENWKSGEANVKRGQDWFNVIYAANQENTSAIFSYHKDFEFLTKELTYGFYLSDHSILGPVETELVVLSAIMIQNLPLETAWHLRGIRRTGVTVEDTESVQQCIELVAEWASVRVDKVPRVKDIEHEV